MKEKVTAIVLAAGKGSRMHSEIQKQYMTLLDRPVITYALEAFEKSSVDEIILVVAPGEIEYAQENIADPSRQIMGICHGEYPDSLQYTKDLLLQVISPKELVESTIGCAIGAHTGRGIIGIVFFDAMDDEFDVGSRQKQLCCSAFLVPCRTFRRMTTVYIDMI